MNVRFVVIAPESKKGTFNIRLPVVVGRSEEAKFRIQQDRVSRKHCEFFAKDDEVFVRDLGSTNGTFLDDEQVETSVKIAVASGAVVRVGSLAFRVEYGALSGTRTTEVRGPRDETDVTIGVKHAGDSERLKIHHDEDAAAEEIEPEAEILEAEIPEAEFQQEELEAESVESAEGDVVESATDAMAADASEPDEPAAKKPTAANPAASPVAKAAPKPEELSAVEPSAEEPKKKPAGKGFDFLAAEPVAEEIESDGPHWPGADADDAPPDDEKLGDFFKGLK